MINGQKYHVSKNLSSVSSLNDIAWASINNTLTTIINALDVGTYTVSFTVELTRRYNTQDTSFYGIQSLLPSSPNPVIQQLFQWGTSDVGTIKQANFVITVTAQRKGNFGNVYFYGCGNNSVGPTGKANFSKIMLNAGSTALPYEPYSTEVWHDTPIPTRKFHNKTDIITTLPVDIYTDGQNASADIIGNMSQSGTPTPQNPIQPSECGDMTVNLFDKENTGLYFYNTSLGQGNKWITSTSGVVIRISCSPSTQYTLSLSGEYSQTVWNIELTNTDSTPSAGNNVTTTAITITKPPSLITTFTTLSDTKYILVQLSQAYISTGGASNIMLNTGSTALPYEPYGYKIPISSANTTTPVYLGEVETTRKIKKYEITGLEGWTSRAGTPANEFFCERTDVDYVNNKAVCSHYPNQDEGSFDDLQDKHFLVRISASGNKSYFGIRDSTYPQTNEGAAQLSQYFQQQYAAGTPVTVWYVLATETTGIVNEPLRKIGDYADTVSGITIPTITGKDTFDVLTTLKPSEVDLTYHGWHDASAREAVRTANIYDKYNILDIPGLGIRYGIECEVGTYSIYNNTDNIVYWGTDDWISRHEACQPHSTATLTIYGSGISGFFMPYNDGSLGEITIVQGSTVPDHYIPYIDWD